MYSNQENHISAYKEWTGIKGDRTPTMGENLDFLFQLPNGTYVLALFHGNFVGRQNDLQGHGGITKRKLD
ncbi:MAG: hypothetical protein IPN13_14605 [Bacteroidetes bacterium]|nr:hypothetical protein [Bacteroidota bacterium]